MKHNHSFTTRAMLHRFTEMHFALYHFIIEFIVFTVITVSLYVLSYNCNHFITVPSAIYSLYEMHFALLCVCNTLYCAQDCTNIALNCIVLKGGSVH